MVEEIDVPEDLTTRLAAAMADLDEKLACAEERLGANLREGNHLTALDRAARRIAALEEEVASLSEQVRQLRGEAFLAWSRVADAELALDVALRPSPGPMPGARIPTGAIVLA